MANNQYVNKVIFGDQTLIDLTSDTVTADHLITGITAHNASGAPVTGTIPMRTGLDWTYYWDSQGIYRINNPAGFYRSGAMGITGIQMTVPSSGTTNTFYIDFPNNSAPASADDWTRITFSVDSNGNSDITDDTIPASGVSF